jgi:hypothetical protein
MTQQDTALLWAKIRSGGPQRVPAGGPTPAGLRRLVEADAQAVWLIPNIPEGASAVVLAEYGLPSVPLSDAKGTLRVLGACVRCCWPDPGTDLWPGQPASIAHVARVLERLVPGRSPLSRRQLLTAGLRRLAASGWVLLNEQTETVRLGPRVATWGSLDLSAIRELWRVIPDDPEPAHGAADHGDGLDVS